MENLPKDLFFFEMQCAVLETVLRVFLIFQYHLYDICHWSNLGLDKPVQLHTIVRALANKHCN